MPRPTTPAQQERNRAVVRGLHLDELAALGEARTEALKQADARLDQIAQRLPDALGAGVSLSEIARIAGVSRQTLYELRARYGDSPGDLSLAVLQALATRGVARASEVAEHVQQPAKDVAERLRSFQDQGFVESEVDQDEEGDFEVFFTTSSGVDLLEHWSFEDAENENEKP